MLIPSAFSSFASLSRQRSINESTMVGIGGYNLRDTYLSPSTDINYTGWVAWVLNERMKIVRLADYNVSRQQLINVEFGSTRNGAETANEYAGFVDYSLGYHYRFPQVQGRYFFLLSSQLCPD